MKVLLIEDDCDIRESTSSCLEEVGGFEVVTAHSGEDGLVKAAEANPNVILLDVMMPIMDGPATLAALRSSESTKHIPIIFLTAKALSAEIATLKDLGAIGVLVKPFDPMSLHTQILTLLEAQ